MSVQETSLAAYADAVPQLRPRQKKVYEILEEQGPMTNLEIAYYLHWPINIVTPRTNELVKLGVVQEMTRRPCRHTGRTSIAWGVVTHKAEQMAMFN